MRTVVTQGICCLFVACVCIGVVKAEGAGQVAVGSQAPESLDRLAWGTSSPAGQGTAIDFPGAVALSAAKELVAAAGPWWSWLGQALAGGVLLALAATVVRAVRRRRRSRELRLLTLYEVPDKADEAIRVLSPPVAPQAPRVLPFNPFLDPSGPNRLSRQIEKAAESSLEFHRVFGLIFFDLGAPPAHEDAQAALDWNRNVADLVDRLQSALRPTDYVVCLNQREIITCIALLPGMTELIGIAGRLRRVGREVTAFSAVFSREAGLAIFPLCGYGGEELIAHARGEFFARNFPGMPRPPLVGPMLENAVAGQG